jgi:eukaryotic-like serine/threonine-protein kinase
VAPCESLPPARALARIRMTPERWRRVQEVFAGASERSPDSRPGFLDDACRDDPDLLLEVQSLLSALHEASPAFLESPAVEALRSVTAPAPPLAAGTRLGPYEILDRLGAGGMGAVYRARDTRLGREVAVKVLPAELASDASRLRRFEKEARSASALNHPNIVTIHDVGFSDGVAWIAMERVDGKTLRQLVSRGALPVKRLLAIATQIADGLATAHAAGIVHRDLKPENVMVTGEERVKILDFGLAKPAPPAPATPEAGEGSPADTLTSPGLVVGTVGYMSPEQVRGQPADARSDIFAAGAVLYEMLTGKPAFRKATAAETMTAILNEDAAAVSQLAPNLPPGLQRTVNRCLSKNPEQRIQHATDLAFALEALSDSGSTGVATAKEQTSAKRWAWIAGAIAAIAIAAAVVSWWARPPATPIIESVTQLTDDGQPKGSAAVVTDGSRVYFNEGLPGSWKVAQVSAAGGETSVISTRLANAQVWGVSPDGSSLVVVDGEPGGPFLGPLWAIPLPTGEPRRVGTIEGQDAGFFPDGRLIFSRDSSLFTAENDGTDVHKLFTAPVSVGCPRVSPDGKRIVMVSYVAKDDVKYLAEAAIDGSGFHEIMRGTPRAPVMCGSWTPDGRYVFTRLGGNIWLLPLETRFFKSHNAMQLTNGPLTYRSLCPSRDGKRLFAVGTKQRGELVRYDMSSKQFTSFLSGISAELPTFSRDGQWLAYVTYPDQALWRSRADGTERLQLTSSPTKVMYPSISPDGKKVAFGTADGHLSVINMDGTSEREIAKNKEWFPIWSPDGSSIAFNVDIEGKNRQGTNQIETFDLQTGKRSVVASSLNLYAASWPTSDTLIAGATNIVALDLRTGKLTQIVSGMVMDWATSPDGKYLYYNTGGPEPKTMRIRLANRGVEEIVSIKDLRRIAGSIAVAPDGSPVFTRDIGSEEIYALTMKWP